MPHSSSGPGRRPFKPERRVRLPHGVLVSISSVFWNGRKVNTRDRYPLVWWPTHRQATKGGLVRIHRAVMADHLGRRLASTEQVHHRDGNPMNWKLENLQLFGSRAAHTRLHNKELRREVTSTCPSCRELFTLPPSRLKKCAKPCCSKKCSNRIQERADWPSDSELKRMLLRKSAEEIGKTLGLSGNAVRKRARRRCLVDPRL